MSASDLPEPVRSADGWRTGGAADAPNEWYLIVSKNPKVTGFVRAEHFGSAVLLSLMIVEKALRLTLRAAHSLLKVAWFVRRPRTLGVHALAFTPHGTVVLVKLRYAPGWRLPGGGRAAEEEPRDAVLRELREEIGLTSHGTVEAACELEEEVDYKRDLVSLFIVRDVEYRPRWSWEVEHVMEATLDTLPGDLSPRMAGWLRALRPSLAHPDDRAV